MKRVSKRFLAACSIALLAAALFLPEKIQETIWSATRDAITPFLQFLAAARESTLSFFSGMAELREENAILSREIGVLRNEIRALRLQARENEELRAQLNFVRSTTLRLLPCEAVGRDFGGWWRTVRVNKGRLDGAAVGWPVISADGLVGRIKAVSAYTSEVLLLSDPAWQASAQVSGRRGSFGVIQGMETAAGAKPVLQITFLDKNVPVLVGDEIETTGLGPGYPAGLLIGRVQRVSADISGLYQHAEVTPAADLDELKFLYIIRMDDRDEMLR